MVTTSNSNVMTNFNLVKLLFSVENLYYLAVSFPKEHKYIVEEVITLDLDNT